MSKNTYIIIGVAAFVIFGGWYISALQKNTPAAVNQSTANTVNRAEVVNATISMKEYIFTPSQFSAGPNQTIKVKLINQGAAVHTFTFSRLDYRSGPIAPGKSKVVTFTTPAKAGIYEFFSDETTDKEKGMKGAMTIQ